MRNEINNETFFSRHLIFEYLPHKEKNEHIPSSCSIPINKDQEDNTSSSDSSVIDKLLGRLPIWPSPPPPSSSSSSSSSSPVNDAGLELLNLLQQESQKDSSDLDPTETNQTSLSIMDRLNEAIRQAQCNNNHSNQARTTENTDLRIAVQA
jgi:hypothetical protein